MFASQVLLDGIVSFPVTVKRGTVTLWLGPVPQGVCRTAMDPDVSYVSLKCSLLESFNNVKLPKNTIKPFKFQGVRNFMLFSEFFINWLVNLFTLRYFKKYFLIMFHYLEFYILLIFFFSVSVSLLRESSWIFRQYR